MWCNVMLQKMDICLWGMCSKEKNTLRKKKKTQYDFNFFVQKNNIKNLHLHEKYFYFGDICNNWKAHQSDMRTILSAIRSA